MAEDFKPRKYDVTRNQLEAWRNAGESTVTIGNRFAPPVHHDVVRGWLVGYGLPTTILRRPASDEPPGKSPRTKRAVFDAERAARNPHNQDNPQPLTKAMRSAFA